MTLSSPCLKSDLSTGTVRTYNSSAECAIPLADVWWCEYQHPKCLKRVDLKHEPNRVSFPLSHALRTSRKFRTDSRCFR